MESKNEYYNSKRNEVLENKNGIIVFKKTIFGTLRWHKWFSKDCYTWIEDGDMYIISKINE